MVCVKIKGKKVLTDREHRFLSEEFRNYFMSYDLEYVFLCEDSKKEVVC